MTKMIDIQHLKKTFGKNEVLKDISASVEKGQVICIIGPSGFGKSTFLRCLNVLEHPTAGKNWPSSFRKKSVWLIEQSNSQLVFQVVNSNVWRLLEL